MTKTKYTIKKTILSILALVLTFVALGTTTFAWFSLSTVSKVSNITANVKGGEGLEVRLVGKDASGMEVDATGWKANLSGSDVEDFIERLLGLGFVLDAVTSSDGKAFKKADEIDKNYVVNGQDAKANVDYIEFEVQFRSPTAGNVVFSDYTLEKGGTSTETFKPTQEYLQAEGYTDPDNLEMVIDPSNGARISIVKGLGTGSDNAFAYQKPGEAYSDDAGVLKGNDAGNKVVEFGQYSYLTDSKGIELYYNNSGTKVEGNFLDIDSTFIDAEVSAYDDAEEEYTSQVEMIINTDQLEIAEAPEDYYVASFIVRIWIEGWDADTYDVFYLSSLAVILEFEKIVD